MVRVRHRDSKMLLAEGPLGWGITPFEGNFYIRRRYLKTKRFRTNFVPGLCPYKFLYVWLDLHVDDRCTTRSLGWMSILPNPLLPFTWFRVAVPRHHPEIEIEET